MLEKYIQLKMFFEYELPLIMLIICGVIFLLLFLVGFIISKHEQRQKKQLEKYFRDKGE